MERNFAGSGAYALVAGDKLIPLGASLGEDAEANLGTGSVPTERSNYVSTYSNTFKMSELQLNSNMRGGITEVPKNAARVMLNTKRQVNNDLIYGKKTRVTSPTSGDGLVYTTDGFFSQVTDNHLNLNGNNGLLEWKMLNHYFRPLFEDTNSSMNKVLFAGTTLFGAFSNLAYARHAVRPAFDDQLGSMVIQDIETDEGGHFRPRTDRYGFSGQFGMAWIWYHR